LPIAKKHYRLKLADALSAHERALRTGGLEGILNPGLIESALARPYSGYYPQIWQKAGALVQSMASNHGFADGNKRSTLLLVHTLITNSGYRLKALNNEDLEQALEDIIVAGASHETTIEQLTEWFRLRVEKLKPLSQPN
jgi:death-on-curing protein